MPDPADPRAVADDPSGIVQQMLEVATEVLPCPFCGCWAEIGYGDAQGFIVACCITEGCPGEKAVAPVQEWNRRSTEADLRAEVERLRCMIDRAAEILSNCSVESGVCCCGDAMDNHTAPMHSGHSPVDQGSYITDEWLKSYRALSPETDGGQDG